MLLFLHPEAWCRFLARCVALLFETAIATCALGRARSKVLQDVLMCALARSRSKVSQCCSNMSEGQIWGISISRGKFLAPFACGRHGHSASRCSCMTLMTMFRGVLEIPWYFYDHVYSKKSNNDNNILTDFISPNYQGDHRYF